MVGVREYVEGYTLMLRGFLVILLLTITALIAATFPAQSQGLPVARLECETTIQSLPVQGIVEVSLFTYGSGASLGNAGERAHLKFMILEGRGNEIPGVLNVIGIFQVGQSRMDFDVMLTGGNVGTGQYWFNGMSHRGTIFELTLVQGGFIARDENGATARYACQ